ncbi:glucose dehydrogenase [FAD, quinone] [Anabrus simplex]|uniref:glucose dehydrogenase [FAD, quinone] n=1 Tax=Anabrus simplex TaxID=316456 RepID=UPI0035A3C867
MEMETLLLFLVTAQVATNVVSCHNVNIAAMFPAIMERERISMQEPCDDNSEKREFDFIIVGAGAAGCVIANRLTEVEDWEVLLLEAGGEETVIMDIPRVATSLQESDINWHYKTIPSETKHKGHVGGQIKYPSGKVVGGSTVLNLMVYVRGNKNDYDNWERMGNPGWKYEDVFPYFKKVENMQIPQFQDSEYHSTKGNIKINYPPYRTEMSSTILRAGKEMGQPEVDYNGEHQTGFARLQTTTANGSRWTASKGYLHPIRKRRNLHLKKRALVTKILINEDTKTAYGVNFIKGNKNYTVYARKEVIISAGAINSPQLLMLSGVGPKEHLEELGIKVIQDSKVGYNLMDHAGLGALIFTVNESKALPSTEAITNIQNYYDYFVSSSGPLTSSNFMEVASFQEMEGTAFHSPGWPNVENLFISSIPLNKTLLASVLGLSPDVFQNQTPPRGNQSAFHVYVFALRPKSRGRIRLKDNNIFTSPLIDPNIFDEEEDILLTTAAIRKIIEFTQAPALQKMGATLDDTPVAPCQHLTFASDEYWRCALLQTATTTYHQCGTCKMGPATDETAVVDPELKVYGIRNLRVIDASIFPRITSGHIQGPTYMVAEKGADLIKKQYLITSDSDQIFSNKM